MSSETGGMTYETKHDCKREAVSLPSAALPPLLLLTSCPMRTPERRGRGMGEEHQRKGREATGGAYWVEVLEALQ